jgi:hypothetical protein
MSTTPQTHTDTLPANINVKKMRANTWLDYFLDKHTDWIKELLLELNENNQELSENEKLEGSHLDIEIKLKKCFKGSIGDYLLCHAVITSDFNTLCVKTGAPMKDTLDFEVKMCFLPENLSEQEEFADQTEHFTDGEIYELYYLNKNTEAPLKEAIHEQLFLNLNFYPSIDN